MKTDLYTKIILTVIALSLVIIVCQNMNIGIATTARADMPPSKAGVLDVNIVSVNGSSVGSFKGIPVSVENVPKVDVKYPVEIKTGYNGLDVNVKNAVEIKTGYGGLSVNVSNYRDFK